MNKSSRLRSALYSCVPGTRFQAFLFCSAREGRRVSIGRVLRGEGYSDTTSAGAECVRFLRELLTHPRTHAILEFEHV